MAPLKEDRLLYGFVGAFGVVAAAFVLASIVAAYSSRDIDRAAADLLSNALPSVNELMNARTALRRLEVDVDALASQRPPRPSQENDVEQSRADLETALAGAAATPWYAGEHEIYDAEIVPRMRELGRALDALTADIAGGRASYAAADLARFDSAANGVDLSLASLAEVNHAGGYAAAWRIVGTRAHIVRVALLLDVASTGLAVVAGAVAIRAARKFARMARRSVALEADRAQELDMFAQRVAHDLMSPLAAVTLSLGRIQRAHPDPETTRAAERAQRALERARHMVDSIYHFAGSGARPAPGARAPLRATILEAVDEQLASEGASPPSIEVERFDELEVATDRSVLGVIVSNLLSNASKFTKGSPERRITVRASAGADVARVEVEDTGPGVAPGFEEAIFEPYRRAPGVDKPGIGLGLATVRRLVGAYGGATGVRHAEPTGAIFWFELPRAPAPPAGASTGPATPAPEEMPERGAPPARAPHSPAPPPGR